MVTKGFYQHYKGDIYFVYGVGQLHDNEKRIVVYESTKSVTDGIIRLRDEQDFEKPVPWPDGQTKARFTRLDP